MKKYYEYLLNNQVTDKNWDLAAYPIKNINSALSELFFKIESGLVNNEITATTENVYTDHDYIKRTVATTNNEITEEQYLEWASEFPYLLEHHGHKYVREFGSNEEELKSTIARELGLVPESVAIRLQIEEPGHYFMLHLDRHKYKEWDVEPGKSYEYNSLEEFHKHSIFIVFMKDWAHGQAVQMGDSFLKWRAGDVFTWDYRNIPHGTSNFGYDTNYIFVITGNKL